MAGPDLRQETIVPAPPKPAPKPAKARKATPRAKRKAPAPRAIPEQTSFDSLQAAAAALGIDKGTLQAAKDQGAPGFKGSRVYPAELPPWILQAKSLGGLRDKRTVEREIAEEKLDSLRWEKERDRGAWIRKAEVEEWMMTTAERVKSTLRARLKNDLPPKLEGLRAAEIAAKMERVIEELVLLFRKTDLGSDSRAAS